MLELMAGEGFDDLPHGDDALTRRMIEAGLPLGSHVEFYPICCLRVYMPVYAFCISIMNRCEESPARRHARSRSPVRGRRPPAGR